VNYLPTRLSLTGENAPPPKNPRLQQCIEEHVLAQYDVRGADIRAQVAKLQGMDTSFLPKRSATDLENALKSANDVFGDVEAIKTTAAAVARATPDYRPLHRTVRALEGQIRRYDAEINEMQQILRRRGIPDERRARLEKRIAEEQAEIKKLRAQIPATWADANKAFRELQKAETNARRKYRRTAQSAYTPIAELDAAVSSLDALSPMRARIEGLAEGIGSDSKDAFADKVRAVRSDVRDIEGTRDIARALNRARRAYPDKPEEARSRIQEALAALDAGIAWRRQAAGSFASELAAYRASISDTIGIREQPRLPPDTALAVAACQANHRDISLNF
ncbi:MAG: C4-dicarboxylate ABC transporter permease, partial [Pseudomonadota bacterium]